MEDLRPVLARCDRLLAHSPQDLNRLKTIGLAFNTALLPHGVIDTFADTFAKTAARKRNTPRGPNRQRNVSDCFLRLLLPHKGLEELLDAVALLRDRGRPVSLRMLNTEYPAEGVAAGNRIDPLQD